LSVNLFPKGEYRWFDAKFIHARPQILNVGRFPVRVEMRVARPVFVKKKFRRIIGRNVKIIIDAAGFLAGRREQARQCFAQFGFLAGPRLKGDNEGDGFCVRVGMSVQ
jgi:hypothetical protein